MTIVSASNLGLSYGAHDVFTDISFGLSHGDRVGLVGPNGQGKTSLLRLIVGEEKPTAGSVSRARGLRLGYLQQEAALNSTGDLRGLAYDAFSDVQSQASKLADLERAMSQSQELTSAERAALLERYGRAQAEFEHAGGYTYEVTIEQVLGGLGFDRADYDRPLRQLSGGEQTRAQLARLLLERPELLLLDEPTNHLDLAAIEWLEAYLKDWPGTVLIVSHDRYFLDKVVNRIWELSQDGLERYRGNYSQYARQRVERRQRRRKEYKAQQAFIAKEEEFIRRNLAGQRTRQAQGRRQRLARVERLERVGDDKTINLRFNTDLRSGDLVLATHDLVIGYPDDEPLLAVPDLTIYRGQRVALIGPNGAGKTTFVKTILDQVRPKAGAIRFGAAVEAGYLAQVHADLNPGRTVLEELTLVENLTYAEARNFLGQFLFSGDDVYKQIGDLSGGERSRVALAKLALTGANFLILDEPTNHLDIPSREILEAVLKEFTGTILVISHDRYFIEALASHVWALEDGTVQAIEGGYDAYVADRAARSARQDEARPLVKIGEKDKRSRARAEKREAERHAQRLADLEARINATEARLMELAQAMEQASLSQDVPRLRELGQEYHTTEATLKELFDDWLAMEAA
ncbi:MAG: ABC-F family ATP-binding cassette domain-containing protein [Anaerolineae bacterium]